jgi:hypothetical protein
MDRLAQMVAEPAEDRGDRDVADLLERGTLKGRQAGRLDGRRSIAGYVGRCVGRKPAEDDPRQAPGVVRRQHQDRVPVEPT